MVATSLSPAKGGSEGKSTFQCQFPPIPPSTTIPLRERVEVAQEQQKAAAWLRSNGFVFNNEKDKLLAT